MFQSMRVQIVLAVALLTMAPQPAIAASQKQADQDFAEQKWQQAQVAYEALLADESSAANWFNLARSRQELHNYAGARDAYLKAIAAEYQPLGQARYYLARTLMSLAQRDAALDMLELMATTGGPSHRTLLAAPEFTKLQGNKRFDAVIKTLTPCSSPEYRQFDFWLGNWDVMPVNATRPTASNRISVTQDRCAVLEEYTNGTFTGVSINFYDSVAQKWHQTWISNSGGAVYLEGGLNKDGAMEMTDKDLPNSHASGVINRVIWTLNEDGSVRQFWQTTPVGELNWTVAFDGLYTKQVE